MYNIEIHKRIKQIIKIYHRFGMWHNEGNSNTVSKIGFKFFYLILHTLLPICFIYGGLITNDKNESAFSILCGIVDLVLTVKLAYVLWKGNDIYRLIMDISTHTVADFKEFAKANEKITKLMKYSCGWLLVSTLACTADVIVYLPLFSSKKRLPLDLYFPLDWENSATIYWMTYASLGSGILIGSTGMSLNVIIWYLMINCGIKYEILGNQFGNMNTSKLIVKGCTISETEKEQVNLKELLGLIDSHQNIEKTICKFKSCFENLFLVQIFTSAICICSAVFVLAFRTDNEDRYQIATNCVMMLFYNIFDIFMVMYFGNEIKLSRDRLSYNIFRSDLMEQSRLFKKCVAILTEVLKRPQELVIAKLFPLNLQTFTSILNLAYSMFNILKNMK